MEIIIPEKDDPKLYSVSFKVSATDKEIIENFCEENNYRVSAFCRVVILEYIRNEKTKKGDQ
jgi:O-succinylbenzoate synthase